MKKIRFHGLALAVAMGWSAAAGLAGAQEAPAATTEPLPAEAAEGDQWYYRTPPPKAEKRTLAQEKAIARGQQRMARLEAMRWYGFSGSRPTATAMPFTTMYSPAWQMPGGRPFAWYTSSRPIVIYHHDHPVYR
jgi:hypothetical protein